MSIFPRPRPQTPDPPSAPAAVSVSRSRPPRAWTRRFRAAVAALWLGSTAGAGVMGAGALASGCGDSHAEEVCQETVERLADAWQACGYDRASKHTELVTAFRQCDRVEAVRDEEALRDDCFPALQTLDCTALEVGDLPAPCLDQIRF